MGQCPTLAIAFGRIAVVDFIRRLVCHYITLFLLLAAAAAAVKTDEALPV